MLEFIIGRSGTGKTQSCLAAVKEKLLADPEGRPLIILVPDHMTFAVEKQLAVMLKDSGGFMRAYVLGMSRLSYQILQKCGGALHPHLSEIGKQLLLSRVLRSQKLSVLAKAARQHHFTSSVSGIIEEFKTAGISAAQLKELTQLIGNETLKQKLRDLASIYSGLDAQMEGRYHDSEDIMSLAIRRMEHCTWLHDSEVWIDGFDAFNQQHLLVIKNLLHLCRDVHLTLCINNLNAIEHESQTALFHRQYIVYKQVSELAHRADIKIKTTPLVKNHRVQTADLSFIEQQLFSFPLKTSDAQGGLHIVEAANRRLECEAAAADMLRLNREHGFRRNDIGVLLRDESTYSELLQMVLHDYGIPCFCDSKRQTAHHPLAELIRSALEGIRTFQYEPLFRAFKTGFFDISADETDCLENYVIAFGIRGKTLWLSDDDWQFVRISQIDGLSESDEQTEHLSFINDIRRRAAIPLKQFSDKIHAAHTAIDFTKALYDFLTILNVPQKLENWQAAADEQSDADLAKEHQQIWNGIVELMDQIVQTCGSDEMNLADYEQLVNDGLDSISLALIPPSSDYVTIAPFEHNTLNNKKAIYILGGNEGILPRRSHSEGLLSDAERILMAGIGINISSGACEDNFAERYLLYKGFSLSSDYLWVSYALSDADGKGLSKSILISRLHKILPQAAFTSIPLEIIGQDKTIQLATKRRALSGLVSALRRCRNGDAIEPFWHDVYNYLKDDIDLPFDTAIEGLFAAAPSGQMPPQLAAKIYAQNKVLRGSVTRFEEFYRCPFRHFAHYALNLRERQQFKFAAPDLGVLLHAVMHRFGAALQEKNRSWPSVSEEECRIMCHDIVNQLAPQLQNKILLSSSRYKHLLQRIEDLAAISLKRLIKFSKHSQFQPRTLEQHFGGRSDMQPLTFDDAGGCKIEITGQIDRIDTAEGYYLVIDYKSGQVMINLLQVYYGLRLQLLTYLLAAKNAAMLLCNMPDAVPAGILYCFLRRPSLTSKKHLSPQEIQAKIQKEMRMPGWVLADIDVIRRIDDSLQYIKVNLTSKDTIHSNSLPYVKTKEEFELLMNHIEQTLCLAGKRILSGETRVFPYKLKDETACTYCPYAAVCRFDKDVSGYVYNEIDDMDDGQIIELLQRENTPSERNDDKCPGQQNN